jgi:PAS domain S-box-containing protein
MTRRELRHTSDDELIRLIDTLHATQQDILRLGMGRVDAVVQTSGSLLLLPDTQSHFRDEAALHRTFASERKAILDALPVQVALLGVDGDIRVVNSAWSVYAATLGDRPGYRPGELYCDHWRAEGRQGCADAERVMARIAATLDGRDGGFTLEYQSRTLPGLPWLQLALSPLADGAAGGAVVMHYDISDRKRAEESQRESSARLNALIEEAPLAILVHCDLRPVIVNAAFAELFGYDDPEAVLGWPDLRSSLAVHLEPDLVGRVVSESRHAFGGGQGLNRFDCRAKTVSGTQLDLDIRLFAMQWQDRQAVGMMISDVTGQKAKEEQFRQMQRLEALGQLTGGIAHDFNNLLTVILGNAEVLEDSFASDTALKSAAELVRMAAEKGAALTNRLLAFARRQTLDPKVVDVGELLSGMALLLSRTIGDHVSIRLVQPGETYLVLADPSQLENAILNLCINARDAMPNGGTITIATGDADINADNAADYGELEVGRYVRLSVADTGCGMDEATASRAFEPFFTTKQAGKGSGLGLSMVYGFLKQSRGAVTIVSQPGAGAEVVLWLPRQWTAVPERKPVTPQFNAGNGERILVAEDDDLVRDYVCQQLQSLGYRVVAASSAAGALAILKADREFDLLFSDILMAGGINGLQLADAAMALRPGLRLLLTSGYADALAEAAHARFGDNFLPKPYKRDMLASKLQAMFGASTSGGR